MNFCIIGPGAVGCSLAVPLAQVGHDVSVVARGAQLDAIRAHGLTWVTDTGAHTARVRVSTRGEDLPRPDVIVVTVKATALASTIPAIASLAGDTTPIVFALNGVPWWYPHSKQAIASRTKLDLRAIDLGFLDPGGALAQAIGIDRVIGCIVYTAGRIVRPGVVHDTRVDHRKLIFGEIDETLSARVTAIGQAFAGTGFETSIVREICSAMWRKLVTNVAQSAICCLTRQPMAVLGRSPELLRMAKSVMREVSETARAWGSDLQIDVDTHFGERSLSSLHRPSMLQDLEAGRATEIEALLLAVQACARAASVATPTLDGLTALTLELVGRPDRGA
jgi:2-dehydropantoate 2-reductase